MKKPLLTVGLVALALSLLICGGLFLPVIKETLTIGSVSDVAYHTGLTALFGGTANYGVHFTTDYLFSLGLLFAYATALLGGLIAVLLGTRHRGFMILASMNFFAAMILLILSVVFFCGANGFNIASTTRVYVMTWEMIVAIVLAGLGGLWTFGGTFVGLGQAK
ncbi:MAG: hypothetical protein NTV44_00690 [Firmicutes bacterium]|nr:hypothetical protein [Bacillota bacterium]